jgi:hypothetical protein
VQRRRSRGPATHGSRLRRGGQQVQGLDAVVPRVVPPARPMTPYTHCSDVPFDNVVRFLECFERVKKGANKAKQLENFRLHNVVRPSDDIFQIYRLLLPGVGSRCAP